MNKKITTLHAEMIKEYHGDAKRIQHFCKVHSYAKLIAEMEGIVYSGGGSTDT